MSSSASVVSLSSPRPSNSDIDAADEEYEYEYEEIEEEIEVEEEVEEEMEEEDVEEESEVEIGEAAADEPQIGDVKDEDCDEDNNPQIGEDVEAEEFEDNEPQIGDDLTPVAEGNDTNQILETEEHGEHTQPGFETLDASLSKPLKDILTRQESVCGFRVLDPSENEISQVKGEITPKNDHPKAALEESGEVNNVKKEPVIGNVEVALTTTDIASKEMDNDVLSVVAETEPPAFEVEDMQISPTPSPRLHVPYTRTRDLSSSAEFDGGNKRQKRVVCEFYARGWCIKGDSCRFLHVKEGLDATVKKSEDTIEASSNVRISPKRIVENSNVNGEVAKSIVHKDNVLRSVGNNSFADNHSNYISPLAKGNLVNRNSTHRGNFSGSVSDYHQHNASIVLNEHHRSSDLSLSHPRQPSSFGLSSWNTNTLGTHKPFESNLERRASVPFSVQLGASPFSYYEPENLSRNRIFKVPTNYKSKMSSYDWEPSIPFRPSHVISINILSKESLYDPLHDSVEQTKIRDVLEKSSNSGQGSSMLNVHMQSNNLEANDNPLTSVNVGDTGKFNLLSSSDDNRLNLDKPRDLTELKVDESHVNHETGTDFKKEGHLQNEEKALKNFQAALIEYLKELVKPTWREGLMSKDAHKLIVKKSMDKVLSTLQPEQVPNTPESIKFYLSSSHSKLAKLVEGYIEKYGKS